MRGAVAGRQDVFAAQRDHALMTAYFGGNASNWDWAKAPAWSDWLTRMTQPKRRKTSAELLAGFRRLAANSRGKKD